MCLSSISQFRPPNYGRADGAFGQEPFITMLNQYDVSMRPIPPQRHQKNIIEPEQDVIRSLFLRIKDQA